MLPGPVTHERIPQALYASESLSQALRQLMLYGRDGLPVLSADGGRVEGWITNASAIHAIARDLGAVAAESTRVELEADLAAAHQTTGEGASPNPLTGYRVIEVVVEDHSRAVGKTLETITWPPGHTPVSILHRRVLHEADPALPLAAGDRVNLLVHRPEDRDDHRVEEIVDNLRTG